jgi:flagellar M-ring protein FliF
VLQKIKGKLSLDKLNLDPRLVLGGMAALAALLALAVGTWLWRDQGSYRPLYGAGEAFPAAEVMQVLDAEAIAYQLNGQSGQVMVREDQIAQARMLLTARGVEVRVPAGYELFDREEPLGTSRFVQDVRLKRSLEGELARSIMTLKGVEQARVHLALEESSSFVLSKRDPAKASVVLQLAPGYRVKPEQVSAILNLVANSVPQLEPEAVSVVDQHGALLSRGIGAWGGAGQNWQVVEDYQRKAVANIEEVLAPVLGAGNYRISVSADIDFSQKEETQQSYGEAPRLRSEQLREESVLDQLALGVPGSLSNRPVAKPEPTAAGAKPAEAENKAATSLRSESTRQMEYDQTVVHVKHAPYSMRQQSVAVVLNAASAPEGGWTPAARKELEAMVRSAVGFNEQRGDLLTVSVFAFNQSDASELAGGLAWWENSRVHDWAKLGVFALISLLLLLLVVRPLIRTLSLRALPAPLTDADVALPEGLPAERAERLLTRFNEQGSEVGLFSELNPLSEIRLPAAGSGLELQIEHLQMLAQNDPERVSEVIKQWIGRNERDAR